jgi:nitrite reductase/ring-hydroxylating ferredoxin subunit
MLVARFCRKRLGYGHERRDGVTEFVTIASVDELEGKELAAFEVEGEQIAVANVDGSFHAFGDICPHRQCSLGEGKLAGTVVTCPCHGSEFDVTSGDRLVGPAVRGVRSYPVRVENDALQVGL